jgi:hypothetical protein
MVDESPSDDNSVAVLHPNTMEALGLFRYVQLSWPLFTGVQTLTQAQRRRSLVSRATGEHALDVY